ncbi:MAG: ATP-binding cassette domain-containing protein [Rhodoferax sp.]|nr:MAG: ATP-binding cassette domain-containing protein [Rhodoferax sp.]
MTHSWTSLLGIRRHGEVADALRAGRRDMRWALLGMLGVNLLVLTPTIYMLQLYERVLYSFNAITLLAVSVMAAVLLAGMALADRLRSFAVARMGLQLEERLAAALFQHGLQQGFAGEGAAGAARLRDLGVVTQFIRGSGFTGLLDLPWSPLYIAVTWLLHPWLGAAILVFVCLQMWLAWQSRRLIVAPTQAAQALAQVETAFVRWKLRCAEVVAAMGMGPVLEQRWAVHHQRALDSAMDLQALSSRLGAWSKALRYIQQSLALGLGGWLVIRGELSAGAMIAGTMLTTRALAPVDAVVTVWRDLLAARQALMRLDTALTAEVLPLVAAPDGRPLRTEEAAAHEGLRLSGVNAWVPGGERQVLHGIHLQLRPGEIVAVVGPSGAGKSTLAKLVAGAWPCASGHLARSADTAVGYLPQDIELYDGTVAENIARLGMPNPGAVVGAAQLAGLHELILRLPKGYDTPLGDGRHPLTPGQSQRVALARALYGSPRLLVLDEPNAHLDDAGERALKAVLQDVRAAGGMVLLVTHRQGLLDTVDRVIALERGVLVANETPEPSLRRT